MITLFVWILIALLITALCLWVLGELPGVDATLKRVARIGIIGLFVIWVVYLLAGFLPGFPGPSPRWR